jgi:hypothetical protein
MNERRSQFLELTLLPLIMILGGCSSLGPNEKEFRNSLQSKVPNYWEVQSIQIEGRENQGSNTIPRIQTRFKSSVKLKEDTFKEVRYYQPGQISKKRLEGVVFVTPADKKGKDLTIYGQAISSKYTDAWQTSIDIDGDPFGKNEDFGIGLDWKEEMKVVGSAKVRSLFSNQGTKEVVVIQSAEEEAWKSKISQQIKAERKQLLALLFSKEHEGSYRYTYSKYPVRLRFVSPSPDSKKITGQIKFGVNYGSPDDENNVIEEIQGTLSDTQLQFKVTKVIKSSVKVGNIGAIWTFPLANLSYENVSSTNEIELEGFWKNNGSDKAFLVLKDVADRE